MTHWNPACLGLANSSLKNKIYGKLSRHAHITNQIMHIVLSQGLKCTLDHSWQYLIGEFTVHSGLILHGGNEGDCLRCPMSLPWCPRNAPVEIYNFLIGCPLPKKKCLGALALSKTKHTAMYI